MEGALKPFFKRLRYSECDLGCNFSLYITAVDQKEIPASTELEMCQVRLTAGAAVP